MEQYHRLTSCVKCGYSPAITGNELPASVFIPSGGAGLYRDNLVKEHIQRTCPRCEYRWKEAPLDKSETPQLEVAAGQNCSQYVDFGVGPRRCDVRGPHEKHQATVELEENRWVVIWGDHA